MYRDIIKLLKCPVCGEDFSLKAGEVDGDEIVKGEIYCKNNHSYEIFEGVLNFNSIEQSFGNSWSECYKETDFDEIDRQIASKTPDNLKFMYNKTIDDIIGYIEDQKPKHLVDIATGRGMLLTKLIPKISSDIHIICTDLSFEVLMYDRVKVKRIKKDARVSFIACDATNMPIRDNSIDGAVSLFGIQNMIGIMDKGIQEGYRILKPDGRLVNSFILVNSGTSGYENMQRIAEENNIDLGEDFGTKEWVDKAYGKTDFKAAVERVIDEGIGIGSDIDLIPFNNEWFKISNMYSCKKQKV